MSGTQRTSPADTAPARARDVLPLTRREPRSCPVPDATDGAHRPGSPT